MTTLAYDRTGEGPPLLLVHGIGSRRQVWEPVVPLLAASFDVIAIDLPGFGDTPPLAGDVEPSAGYLATVVAEFGAALDLQQPHVAGNSLGGWIAFELARTGYASSATGICPAGLWKSVPRYTLAELRFTRMLCRALNRRIDRLAEYPFVATALSAHLMAKPWKVPSAAFAADVKAFGTCPGFEPTLTAFKTHRFTGGRDIDVPVTVAIGSHDILLNRGCRERDQLPTDSRWITLHGCGHTPMYDDPDAVADVIASTARPTRKERPTWD